MKLQEPPDRPLSVCHLGKYYPPASGGMETHVQTLAQGQAALGWASRVVCVNQGNDDISDTALFHWCASRTIDERDGDVDIIRVGRRAALARLDLCPDLPRVLRDLWRNPPDIVHLHTPNPCMLLALSLARIKSTLVITHHSDIIRQRFLRYALDPFERWIYGQASLILATSPAYAAASPVLQRYRRILDRLPLGLDLTSFAHPSAAARTFAKSLQYRLGSPIWLGVGRLTYYKGFDIAIRALPHVAGTLALIGTGPQETELRRLADGIGVADRVAWLGHVEEDDLVGAYHAATAFWFPSNARSEGFGLVQVEAMASGCPPINTAIPGSGVTWVSPHEETGLTVAVNDPVALARAARRLVDEPELRQRLAAEARKRAWRDFDHRIMARRSVAFYQQALAKESPIPLRRRLALGRKAMLAPTRG